MNTNIKTREYTTVSEVSGPLMVVEGVEGVGYNEIVDIETPTVNLLTVDLKSSLMKNWILTGHQ